MADPAALARRVLGESGYLDSYRLRPRLDLAALLKRHELEWHRRPFSGLAGALIVLDDEYYVVTNSREGWARQRFTAAHEFKHYLTDRSVARVSTCRCHVETPAERAANVFARELLMPEETIRWLWDRGIREPGHLGYAVGVSVEAITYRLGELGLGQRQREWG